MEACLARNDRDAAALSALLDRIYDAAMRPERWTAAVAAIARSFGCTKALLFTPYVSPHNGGLAIPCGIGEDALQLWASSYIDHDLWSLEVARRGAFRPGTVLLDEQMVPRAEFLASKFYTEFLSRLGIGRVCAGVVFGNEPGLVATSFCVFRAPDEPPFDKADIEWMEWLISHVSRSLGVMQRLDTMRLRQASLLASFDRLDFGVVLLDAAMRVVHTNTSAKAVLARHDGLAIGANGQLESTAGAARKSRLSQWLERIRDTPLSQHSHFLDGCRVPRSGSHSHYIVQCSALGSQEEWDLGGGEFHYVAFITDPAALKLPREERLMQLYGLTQMQARVALAFAGGATYKNVARSLRISEETVR
ncbi:MAG: hypothetical protein SXG53_27820, partial [Pseudomonadota bacterium]|nr:hypothetical protein [Pseudomonadota bacterium]